MPVKGGSMKKHLAAAAAILLALPAQAAESVKIGFVTTLSGPAGIIGKHMKDASDLALAMLGGKIGGLAAETLYRADQFKPDGGPQAAAEPVERAKPAFLRGFLSPPFLPPVTPTLTHTHPHPPPP